MLCCAVLALLRGEREGRWRVVGEKEGGGGHFGAWRAWFVGVLCGALRAARNVTRMEVKGREVALARFVMR